MRVSVCHEVTDPVISAADAAGCDLLISYHPLLFDAVTRLVAGADPAGRAWRLARAGISVGAVHTAFDVAPGGAADALAVALDLDDVSGFGPLWGEGSAKVVTFLPAAAADRVANAMAGAGAGTIGRYGRCAFVAPGVGSYVPVRHAKPRIGKAEANRDEAQERLEMVAPARLLDAIVAALVASHPYEDPAYDVYERRGDAGFVGRVGSLAQDRSFASFASQVADVLGGVVRVAGPERLIRRVAVVPGSGGSLVPAAAKAGADVLVTGDVSHHRAREAVAAGVCMVDPGHSATERPGVGALYAAVSQVVGDARDLSDLDADPWRAAR